jgi:phosphatidate cytidylyltransferase
MNLSTRIPTAIILISIAIFGIIQGGLFFFIGISLLSFLCLHEILKMKHLYIYIPYTIFLYGILLVFLFLTQLSQQYIFWNSIPIITISIFIVLLSLFETINKKIISSQNNYIQGFTSTLKIGFSLPFFILIRNYPTGISLTLLFIIIIATVDSASYFSGKFLGKTKLSSISPNKTIEGTIGGISTTLLSSICIIWLLNLKFTPYFILTLIIIILAIYGDLHESLQKRKFKIKDSSSILPGHGGIYDRLDSYILALPITYYYYLCFL